MVVRREGKEEPKKKQEFYADLDASKKGACFGCGSCVGLLVAVLVLLALGATSLVAATGVIRVPVLSTFVYAEPPTPSREVTPAANTPISLPGLMNSKLASAAKGSGTITVTEAELTQLLGEPNAEGQVLLKQGQVAIDPDGVEVYGQVTLKQVAQPVVVRLRLVPGSAPDELTLDGLWVGHVQVPDGITGMASSLLLKRDLTQPQRLGEFGIEEISFEQGSATLTLDAATLKEIGTDATEAPAGAE